MSSGFPSLSISTRYEEVGITSVTSPIVLGSGLQKGDRPTLLALLAPDLISIGGILRLSLVLQANKPKIVHGVRVQAMLLVWGSHTAWEIQVPASHDQYG